MTGSVSSDQSREKPEAFNSGPHNGQMRQQQQSAQFNVS